MPRPKKHPKDWTTQEAMKTLFPKKVRDKAKEEASQPQVKGQKPSIKE